MSLEELHASILDRCAQVEDWFRSHSRGLEFPFYSSFDLRDAGFKLGPVDANIFPAGFNNICLVDRENSQDLARVFLDSHYGSKVRRLLLLTEEHTGNPYYWDNVLALRSILEGAGREVRLAVPESESGKPELQVLSASGVSLSVQRATRSGGGVELSGFSPDLIISNNDFSMEYEAWARGLETPINPPRELGWYQRRKDRFFRVYNELAAEFSDLLKLDPWLLQVETEVFSGFAVDDEQSGDLLAESAQKLWGRVKAKYQAHGVTREPFLFVKNNAGTYGLGVLQVKHPEEIRTWSYKARKKMKAAKGGREVTEVIIQEGIPTTTQADGGKTAEPVVYMIGCQLAGGFLRAHGERGEEENLNAPGAVFQRLCLADLKLKQAGCPMENAYGWVARLAFLSVAREARELGVDFPGYTHGGPCS